MIPPLEKVPANVPTITPALMIVALLLPPADNAAVAADRRGGLIGDIAAAAAGLAHNSHQHAGVLAGDRPARLVGYRPAVLAHIDANKRTADQRGVRDRPAGGKTDTVAGRATADDLPAGLIAHSAARRQPDAGIDGAEVGYCPGVTKNVDCAEIAGGKTDNSGALVGHNTAGGEVHGRPVRAYSINGPTIRNRPVAENMRRSHSHRVRL